MKHQPDLESALRPWLEEIKAVPPRDAQRMRRARAVFLNQAVSASELQRHKGWKFKSGKERLAMNILLSILVVTGLLFGGGVTVQAAQNDLPNEPLYGLKTFSEDVSLEFQNTPETQINRLMTLAQVRVQEMTRLTYEGVPVPDQVWLRLEQHIEQALRVCSTLDDAILEQTLLRVRDQLREQDREMQHLRTHATAEEQPNLDRVREMLQLRLRLVDDGLLNHEMFRNAVRNGFRYGQSEEATPPAQNGNGSQYGQPTAMPGGPNPEAGGPNTSAGRPNMNPGGPNGNMNSAATPMGPNSTAGGPNTNPGGPNTDSGGMHNGSGGGGTSTGSGGNGSGGGGGGSGSGGNGPGGNHP